MFHFFGFSFLLGGDALSILLFLYFIFYIEFSFQKKREEEILTGMHKIDRQYSIYSIVLMLLSHTVQKIFSPLSVSACPTTTTKKKKPHEIELVLVFAFQTSFASSVGQFRVRWPPIFF